MIDKVTKRELFLRSSTLIWEVDVIDLIIDWLVHEGDINMHF